MICREQISIWDRFRQRRIRDQAASWHTRISGGLTDAQRGVGLRNANFVQHLCDALAKRLKHGGKDVFLVAEVHVEAPHRAARLGHNHGHGGGMVAVQSKHARRGIEDLAATRVLARLGGWSLPVWHPN